MPGEVDVKTVTLRVVTPVHISGESIPLWMWGTDSEKVYAFDVESLAESAGVDEIPRVIGELAKSSDSWEQYRQFYKEIKGLKPDRNLKRENDLVLFIRSGPPLSSTPYFPGSSIKGSLRTAIIGSALESDSSVVSKLCEYILRKADSVDSNRRNKHLCKFLFQRWYQRELIRKEDSAHHDPFRAVSVSDATVVDGEFVVCNTVRRELGGWSHARKKGGPKSSYEFLVRGTVKFTLRFDRSLWESLAPPSFQNLGISRVDDLLEWWSSWYGKVIEFMRGKGYPLQGVNARRPVILGRLSGYLSKTVAYALSNAIGRSCNYSVRGAVLKLVKLATPHRKLWPETGTCWVVSYDGRELYPGILEIL